jgi:hypothetical protein
MTSATSSRIKLKPQGHQLARESARGRGRVQNSRLWPLLPQLLPPLKADQVMIPLLMAMALLMLEMPTLHRLL